MKQSVKEFVVVGLGAVLWDVFPDGTHFGGAPANFACHAKMLGGQSSMVSCVGQDQMGIDVLNFFEQYQVNTDVISQSDQHPTGTVLIELDDEGKPSFHITPNVAWDFIPWSIETENLARRTNAVCFGSLDQRSQTSQQTIQRFLQMTPADCLRIFDINLRQDYYNDELIVQSLELANLLKLNDEELPVVKSILGLTGKTVNQLEQLKQRFKLKVVSLTRGDKGSILLANEGVFENPGLTVKVKDTVGAGDAFTATLTMGLLKEIEFEMINLKANQVAAYVCSQAGAVPILPIAIQTIFQ